MVRKNPNRSARAKRAAVSEAQGYDNQGQRPRQEVQAPPNQGQNAPNLDAIANLPAVHELIAGLIARHAAPHAGPNAAIAPNAAGGAPDNAQVGVQQGAANQDEANNEQVLMDALAENTTAQAQKEMNLLIKDAVRNGLWRRVKVVHTKELREEAAKLLLEILNFHSMQGDSAQAKALRKRWLKLNEKLVARAINEQRSYVQSRLKNVIYAYWRKNNRQMPSMELLLALIKRDFQVAGAGTADAELDPEDHEALVWWITSVLPIAAGNNSDWTPEHYHYMTVQQGHYPDKPRKLYVTDSTEAIALFIIENNYECWPAQWDAKDEHGDYPIIRKSKEPTGEDVTLENSRVSDHFCCVCTSWIPNCPL